MAQPTTSATLLSRVRDPGDAEAWREFDETYRELILRYSMRRGLQVTDAEDVRQAVMVRLSGFLHGFRYDPGLGRFRDYLRRCVHHEVIRVAAERSRRAARSLDTSIDGHLAQDPPAADDVWDAEWRAHHLRRAMQKARVAFDPDTLDAFERLLAGDSAAAVAAARGSTVEAVQRSKRRVREFLKARILEQIRFEEFPDGDGRAGD